MYNNTPSPSDLAESPKGDTCRFTQLKKWAHNGT